MNRVRTICGLAFFVSGLLSTVVVLAETIELVTYYPAPGAGNVSAGRSHAARGTVGAPYSLTNPLDGVSSPEPLGEGVLLVSNALGIGPSLDGRTIGVLHVVGRASGDSVRFLPYVDPSSGLPAPMRVKIGTEASGVAHGWNNPAAWDNIVTIGSDGNSQTGRLELLGGTRNYTGPSVHFTGAGGLSGSARITYAQGPARDRRLTIGAPNEGIRVDASGRVGIGMATNLGAPGGALQINLNGGGAASMEAASSLALRIDNTSPAAHWGTIGFYSAAGTISAAMGAHFRDLRNSYGDLVFATRGSGGWGERMRIAGNGNVGIGTNNPGNAKLHLREANFEDWSLLFSSPTGYTYGMSIDTNAAGDNVLAIADLSANAGRIYLTSEGRVGIGPWNPTAALHVTGNICYTGIIGGCSDARLKESVQPLTHVLEKLQGLRGVSFRWNERFKEFEDPDTDLSQRQIGLIAQEVERVFPELIGPVGEYKGVDYTRFSAVLLEAVKELKAENESLKKRLDAAGL